MSADARGIEPPPSRTGSHYYRDKLDRLARIFGTTDLELTDEGLRVGSKRYAIVDDVIRIDVGAEADALGQASDIRDTFGAEWNTYTEILPEHRDEFRDYFDLVPLESLAQARVVDLGCGMGRWSWFLKDSCREVVLVDFSSAIFVARERLRDCPHALFFQADIERLPFAADSFDFAFSLGVLHHLPTPALDAVRRVASLAPRLLVYLYYALDGRPLHYRVLLAGATSVRNVLWRIQSPRFRSVFSKLGALLVYRPLVALGDLAQRFGAGRHVPLWEFYRGHSLDRLEQDVYDRFFTRIEQRVSKRDIATLLDTFSKVTISDRTPYWHFLCER